MNIVELKWKFLPTKYFEEPIEISDQLCTMSISNGMVKAKLNSTTFEANPTIREELHKRLENIFLGMLLRTHSPYELSLVSTKFIYPDGHEDIEIGLQGMVAKCSLGKIDIHISYQNGEVILDSKKERIEQNNSFTALISKHSADNLLTELLNSYKKAVSDPDNEFVYLYEIRDALTKKFGNEDKARKTLNISKPQFSDFRSLCNNKNFRQGRHRGQNDGALRDSSENELKKVRDLAFFFINAYVTHLEREVDRPTRAE